MRGPQHNIMLTVENVNQDIYRIKQDKIEGSMAPLDFNASGLYISYRYFSCCMYCHNNVYYHPHSMTLLRLSSPAIVSCYIAHGVRQGP